MTHYISEIFTEKPRQWGLRGDPYFWESLEKYFSKISFPYSENELVEEIHTLYLECTGEKLDKESRAFVEQFAHGGMSSGHLSGEFWIEKGIPMLVERYRKMVEEV